MKPPLLVQLLKMFLMGVPVVSLAVAMVVLYVWTITYHPVVVFWVVLLSLFCGISCRIGFNIMKARGNVR